jgi:hypothetical protein
MGYILLWILYLFVIHNLHDFFLKQHLLHDIVVGFIFKVMAQELLVFLINCIKNHFNLLINKLSGYIFIFNNISYYFIPSMCCLLSKYHTDVDCDLWSMDIDWHVPSLCTDSSLGRHQLQKKKKNITCSYIFIFVSVCFLNASLSRTCWVLNGVYFIDYLIFWYLFLKYL